MKLKTFAIVMIIFCVLLAAVLFNAYPRKTSDRSPDMGAQLLPGLAAGDIAAVSVVSPEGSTTLKQGESGWVVGERFNYPADFSKISDLVAKLTAAKIGRSFAASDEIKARLALYPPEAKEPPADQKGTRVVLADKDNRPLADLLIGKEREGGGDTSYVQSSAEGPINIIDRNFRFLENKPSGWLDKKPLDLHPKQIRKVVLFGSKNNRPVYTLERPAPEKDPVLSSLPKGKKLAKFKADQLFEALTSLTVEDVADSAQKDPARFSGAPRFEYQLYDGTVYQVFPGAALKDGSENRYLRITVTHQAPPVKPDAVQTETQANPAEQAEKVNSKISPWTYVISKWVYDSFITNPADFIEKEEKK